MSDTYIDELKKAYVNGILMDYCGSADRTRSFSGLYEDYCGLDVNNLTPETTTTTPTSGTTTTTTTTTTAAPTIKYKIYYGVHQSKYMDNIATENLEEIFSTATIAKDELFTTEFVYPANSAVTPAERNAQTEEESAAYEAEYACGLFYVLPKTVNTYEIVDELAHDETSLFNKKTIVNSGVEYYLVYKTTNGSGDYLIVLEPEEGGDITFDIKITG